MPEIGIAALKLLAVLSSGFWGYVGIVHDFRGDDGRITAWGKRAVIGVVASTLIAICLQALETHKASKQSREENERTQRMLQHLARAAFPLVPAQALMADTSFSVSLKDPEFAPYRLRLDQWIGVNCNGRASNSKSNIATCKSWGMFFESDSPLMPGSHSLGERALAELIGKKAGLHIAFYRSKPEEGCEQKEFLYFDLATDHPRISIEYDASRVLLDVYVKDLGVEDLQLKGTKSQGSLVDLNGAYLIAEFQDIDYDDQLLTDTINKAEMASRFGHLQLRAAARSFFLGQNDRAQADGAGSFGFWLPDDLLESDVNVRPRVRVDSRGLGATSGKPIECVQL